jgi:hypothetical protein
MFNLKPSLARQHSVEGQPRHRVNSPLSHHRGLDTPPAESAEEEVIMNEAHPLIANRDDSSKDMINYYDGGDNTDPTVQALEISISYGIFFILGTSSSSSPPYPDRGRRHSLNKQYHNFG